jgi:Mycothiol maleylpyruvate isomerase N-terminal domain
VAERGRRAGAALGADPVGFLAELEERVRAKVAAAADDAFVATAAGGMRLVDYLPTRTFELVVHTADLAAALGVPGDPPPEAAASALQLAALLVREHGDATDVLLALTGRRALPPGFTVL